MSQQSFLSCHGAEKQICAFDLYDHATEKSQSYSNAVLFNFLCSLVGFQRHHGILVNYEEKVSAFCYFTCFCWEIVDRSEIRMYTNRLPVPLMQVPFVDFPFASSPSPKEPSHLSLRYLIQYE